MQSIIGMHRELNDGMNPAPPNLAHAYPSLAAEAAACRRCRACPLYQNATQAVFGEGPEHAPIVLVGEQPGDEEDVAGHPFVGPAGALLDAALVEAALPRADVYVTNAVKHFKFIQRGKRRLHERANAREVRACRPWLVDELRLIKPRVVVALGATAARAVFSGQVRVTHDRGRWLELAALELGRPQTRGLLTLHPAAVLRAPTPALRREMRDLLVRDLHMPAVEARKFGREL